jgi:hypothetical protein
LIKVAQQQLKKGARVIEMGRGYYLVRRTAQKK